MSNEYSESFLELQDSVMRNADADKGFQATTFFEIFSEAASDAGDIPDLDRVTIMHDGGRPFRVDGYNYDSNTRELVLAVIDYGNTPEPRKIAAKVSDKLELIKNLLPRVNTLLIGGGMCFTFLKALGHNIGNSLCEEDFISSAKEILDSVDGNKIKLPIDFGVTKSIHNHKRIDIDLTEFNDDDIGIDIGSKTINKFNKILSNSKTIFWNGPMGIFEIEEFSYGTKEITQTLAQLNVYTIVGGGDSVNAINKYSSEDKFNHVSTGGGASLEYLEGKNLPGVNIYNELIIE